MDTGKIFIGIALVMFSAALMVNPTSAYGFGVQRGGCAITSSSAITIAPHTMLSPPLRAEVGSDTGLPTVFSVNEGSLRLEPVSGKPGNRIIPGITL